MVRARCSRDLFLELSGSRHTRLILIFVLFPYFVRPRTPRCTAFLVCCETPTLPNMSFLLRRPFSIATAIKQVPKSASAPYRAFHQSSPLRPSKVLSASKPTSPITALTKSRNAFHRTYIQPSSPVTGPDAGNLTQRLLYGAGIVGATVIATNLIFNRETREDGGMPPFERSYLNETFLHTGLGVGIIGVAARALHQSGWSIRLMATNPWLVIGGGLAMSIGTMYGCFATAPEK